MIDKRRILACYYPTTLVLVDDFQKFLKTFELLLSSNYLCESYQKPMEALQMLENRERLNPLLQNWIQPAGNTEMMDNSAGQKFLSINWARLREQIYNVKRFAEVSVVLVDYAMPSIDGIKFCERLKNFPCKKIMVTGEADYELAVRAFNAGIIDKFIRKNDDNFDVIVDDAVKEMQHKYFAELSSSVIDNLLFDRICLLKDSAVNKLFDDLCSANKIMEYYLVDGFGSYLLLDAYGVANLFIVRTEEELQKYAEIAHDANAPEDIVQGLKKRECIPFFLTEEDEFVAPDDWKPYLHPSKTIMTTEGNFYYAFVKVPACYDIKKGSIKSYNDYLKSLEPR